MRTQDTVALWGCVASSSAWAAAAKNAAGLAIAVAWLVFAGVIAWRSSCRDEEQHDARRYAWLRRQRWRHNGRDMDGQALDRMCDAGQMVDGLAAAKAE